MKLPDLTQRIERLHRLLSDPQPGAITWHMAVDELMNSLVEAWLDGYSVGAGENG